jgi:hypothetical protein
MLVDEQRLNELFDHLDSALEEGAGPNQTLRLTRAWPAERGIDEDALTESVEGFGGYCDCEAVANVDPDEIF